MSTSTRTLTIGELSLKVKSSDLAAIVIDTAVASEFEVEVRYHYEPGHSGNLSGAFEDAEEPMPEYVSIKAVKASASVHFEGSECEVIVRRGTDLLPLFSGHEVTALEDRILKAIKEEASNDA